MVGSERHRQRANHQAQGTQQEVEHLKETEKASCYREEGPNCLAEVSEARAILFSSHNTKTRLYSTLISEMTD